MFDHPITPEEAKRLTSKDTNQEDVPEDALLKFPDFISQHNCCPRCKQHSAREQLTFPNEPLRFRCGSCGGVSFQTDWK